MNHEGDGDTNYIWCTRANLQRCRKGTRNQRTIGNHPHYSNIKIGQNTEKDLENSRRLGVAQPLVKELTLV